MKNIRKERGLSLIELLVSIGIAMLSFIIIVQFVSNASKQKQLAGASSDAQNEGQISMFYMERDIRPAGYGMLDNPAMIGCTINGYNANAGANFTLNLLPFKINAGATANISDSITITAGSADVNATAYKLSSATNGSAASLKLDNRYGFQPGDLFLMFNPTVSTSGTGNPDCTLGEVTNIPGAGQSSNLIKNTGTYTNSQGTTQKATYNKPGGIGIGYPAGSTVYNLGSLPKSITYTTNGTILNRVDNFTKNTTEMTDNVYLLKAYYIKDTDLNGVVDTIDKIDPVTNSDWVKIIGVKIALVMKTTKAESDPTTSITLFPAETLPNGTQVPAVTIAVPLADQNFRYKVHHTSVPLRNLLWKN